MSELDDAIREHLELKRRHGARDAEVKQLEEEAFGTGERPADPFSAADQLLRSGDQGASPAPAEEGTPTDVPPPETPPPPSLDAEAGASPAAPSEEGLSTADDDAPTAQAPAAPEAPAVGEELPAEPAAGSSPIPPPPPPHADRSGPAVHVPTEEHPPPGPPPVQEPPSEEPPVEEPPAEEPAAPEASATVDEGGPGLYDFETDSATEAGEPTPAEAPEPPPPPPAPETSVEDEFAEFEDSAAGDEDDFSDLGPADSAPGAGEPDDGGEEPDAGPGPGAVTADTSEREAIDATEQYPVPDQEATLPPEPADQPPSAPGEAGSEDLLEETPEFLEEKEGKDEDLWFEQRPPKDFDFDE